MANALRATPNMAKTATHVGIPLINHDARCREAPTLGDFKSPFKVKEIRCNNAIEDPTFRLPQIDPKNVEHSPTSRRALWSCASPT